MSASAPGLVEAFAGPRDFTYIPPMGRRISEYEALNVYVQPLERGTDRPVAKRLGWPEESTAFRCQNWYAFRDPAQMWQRPYNKRQAEQERAIERAIVAARDSGALALVHEKWARDALGGLYVPMAFVEHGLFRALSHCSVVALSDVVSVALVFNAFDKERHSQDILFHQHDLHASGVLVGQSDGREAWLQLQAFQPLRRLVEELIACADWGEAVLAVNLITEPLLCRWIFNEALWANAAAHGDRVTPIVLAEAENDRVRNLAWTAAMIKMLLEDSEHGSHNRSLLDQCVGRWRPLVLQAASALEEVVPTGTAPLAESGVDRAWGRWLSALCRGPETALAGE